MMMWQWGVSFGHSSSIVRLTAAACPHGPIWRGSGVWCMFSCKTVERTTYSWLLPQTSGRTEDVYDGYRAPTGAGFEVWNRASQQLFEISVLIWLTNLPVFWYLRERLYGEQNWFEHLWGMSLSLSSLYFISYSCWSGFSHLIGTMWAMMLEGLTPQASGLVSTSKESCICTISVTYL